MEKRKTSIIPKKKVVLMNEKMIELFLMCCATVSVFAVVAMTIYIFMSGLPAFFKVGIKEILLNTKWDPTSSYPQFGIFSMILTSIIGVFFAVCIATPIGIFTAIYIVEMVNPVIRKMMMCAIELLAGIPSIIYGLLGMLFINQLIYQLELFVFKNSKTHQFTGGANLISSIIILAIMILPTLITMTKTALMSVPDVYRQGSLALGAHQMQTIFKVVLPAARNGIISAIVLALGRALGETMALILVAGNSVHLPYPFQSVRFLTTGIVSEMGYAQGLHREVLFSIGLVLFVFVLMTNVVLRYLMTRGEH